MPIDLSVPFYAAAHQECRMTAVSRGCAGRCASYSDMVEIYYRSLSKPPSGFQKEYYDGATPLFPLENIYIVDSLNIRFTSSSFLLAYFSCSSHSEGCIPLMYRMHNDPLHISGPPPIHRHLFTHRNGLISCRSQGMPNGSSSGASYLYDRSV